tara:strand:+ start:708 stop:1004 length:297 start_codon:yes stop_codon:yes gene_type:complete
MTKTMCDGVVRDMTSEEQTEYDNLLKTVSDESFSEELKYLRNKRNKLLLDCDWIELANAPLTSDKKVKWQTYRTNLRNLTNGLDTVDKVLAKEFPTKP